MTFRVDETSTINPGVSLTRPLAPALNYPGGVKVSTPQLFSLGIDAKGSSEAIRTDQLHVFYLVSELLKLPAPRDSDCSQPPGNSYGSLFIDSDLRIKEWLVQAVTPQYSGAAPAYPVTIASTLKDNVLSHEIKYDIVTSGDLTPKWQLVRVTANSPSPLFSSSRDRSQDLLITFGPVAKDARQLALTGQEAFLANIIGIAVRGD